MTDMNKVFEIGRLVRNAEIRYTASNKPICKFTIAVNERRRDGDNWKDVANFFDVMLWGKQSETLNQYLTKGKQIAVEGKLKQDRWDDNGQTRSRILIEDSSVQLLGDGRKSEAAPDAPPYHAEQSETRPQETAQPAQTAGQFGNVPF